MRNWLKTTIIAAAMVLLATQVEAQRLIEYTSGMGARDAENPDVWILYSKVRATHDDMTLWADSALLNTAVNDFTAFRNIVIELSDTTHIYGDRLYYDGNSRVANIWADTVVLVDGNTMLFTNHITYDRNRSVAYYTEWGHGESNQRTLDSRSGLYNAELKEFFIHGDVVLTDSSSRLLTDTLTYNTVTSLASFSSPTNIYTDSTHIYSELGTYNTENRFAVSHRASHVTNRDGELAADTLIYDEGYEWAEGFGHVAINQPDNGLACYGHYGLWRGKERYSYVTGRALATYAEKPEDDSLYVHADTIWLTLDSARNVSSVFAYAHVKAFRTDVQALCDSAHYRVADSVALLFGSPTLWNEGYQCQADTIELHHDSTGVTMVYLRTDCKTMQRLDPEKFNLLKGKQGVVHFAGGEPTFADILGNAQMVFHITEEDSTGNESVVGVNVGVGSDMRIYFDSTRAPRRMVAFGKPDMRTFPLDKLPDEPRQLHTQWLGSKRPAKPEDIFEW
ncbi:MAG: hypothetical protein IJ789_07380 [Bacteroidales bacterium]|nr:hypothetical protein [Bacteroidales bacterium]